MVAQLLRLVIARGATQLHHELRGALFPVAPYLRKLGVGVSLVISSVLAWMTALFFLLLALFFYLGQADSYIGPAFWTGIISAGIGAVLVFFGFNLLKRPNF